MNLAPQWKERGGAVYYTMFESNVRDQPPTDAEMLEWERKATLEDGGEPLFRVLKDPSLIRRLYPGESALPFNVVLNRQMVVQWYKSGGNLDELISQMERLMNVD